MSDYTQQEQTEIVRDAMRLTTAIQIEEKELAKQKSATFASMPAAPVRKVLNVPQIKPEIPPVPTAKYRYADYLNSITKGNFKKYLIIAAAVTASLLILSFIPYVGTIFSTVIGLVFGILPIAAIVLLVLSFYKYLNKRKELNEQLAKSPEYQKQVEDAKKTAEAKQQKIKDDISKQQAEIDAKYKSDLEHYNTVTVPNYKRDLEHFKDIQAKKIAILEEDLSVNNETLTNLYDTTKLISLTYRELWILRWLYDDMSSSDHDVRYATDLLDRHRQRLATEQSGRIVRKAISEMESSMMSGFQAVYNAVEDGNEELSKLRRDQNIANAAEIAQRHNLNKMTKSQNKMLEEQGNLLNKHFNK